MDREKPMKNKSNNIKSEKETDEKETDKDSKNIFDQEYDKNNDKNIDKLKDKFIKDIQNHPLANNEKIRKSIELSSKEMELDM